MAAVADKMLDNKLWVKKGTPDDMQSALLWVLDNGGNLIIVPEMQGSKLKKHGDLSPGATPVDRPFAPSRPEQPTCCCKTTHKHDECAYRKVTTKIAGKYVNNNSTLFRAHYVDSITRCCKWRIGEGCPTWSR